MIQMLKQKLGNCLFNIYVIFLNFFIHRDKNVILIGAWMGLKFADNSRYLYQFLYKNASELKLKKVIWVTRNVEVNRLLNAMGYESYLIGTKESKYWHLKAGIHIICNMAFPSAKYGTDIDTKYSWGAVKFQLWHGVGMKAVGIASNEAKKLQNRNFFRNSMIKSNLSTFMAPGGWNEAFFLSTSSINSKVNQAISGCKEDRLFISVYPRNCACVELLDEEKGIIDKMLKYNGCIMYLPTFRSRYDNYSHPLNDEKVKRFLKENNIMWIEKPHTASDYALEKFNEFDNVLLLDSNFDINVLFSYTSMVLSDYSSAVFDAVYKHIPVIMYTPDLEDFKNGDVGFLFDIVEYCDGILAMDINQCLVMMNQIIENNYFDDRRRTIYTYIKKDFFDDRESTYAQIWSDISRIVDGNME